MTERLTSMEDALYMSKRVNDLLDELEREGFDRGAVAACMFGSSMAVCLKRNGKEWTKQTMERLRLYIEAGGTPNA